MSKKLAEEQFEKELNNPKYDPRLRNHWIDSWMYKMFLDKHLFKKELLIEKKSQNEEEIKF